MAIPGELPAQHRQEEIGARNILLAEIGGRGPYYSLNYGRVLLQTGKLWFSGRLGVSLLPDAFSVPFVGNILIGRKNHYMEFSLGLTPFLKHFKTFLAEKDYSDKCLYLVPGIGYRYQKPDGGWMFTAGVHPSVLLDPPSDHFWHMESRFFLSGSLALGYSF